jgi:hypothetical protein
MRAIPLALVLTLVLVAPPALATCYNCDEGGASTSCVTTDFPTEAEGIVIMWYWRDKWRACFTGYVDGYPVFGTCIEFINQPSGSVFARFAPPWPPGYSIGMTAEAQIYLSKYGNYFVDSLVTVIECSSGYCMS